MTNFEFIKFSSSKLARLEIALTGLSHLAEFYNSAIFALIIGGFMKKWIVTVIVIVSLGGAYYFFGDNTQPQSPVNKRSVVTSASSSFDKSYAENVEHSTAQGLPAKEVLNIDQAPGDSEQTTSDLATDEMARHATDKQFFSDFETEHDVDSSFVNSEGAIYQEALITAFKEDFSGFIEKLNLMGKGQSAIENEMLIADSIRRELDSFVSNQNVSCAGRICAITLTYLENTDSEQLQKLHNSGSFYSFYNNSVDTDGNPQLKAILVAAPDPSQLRIVR